MACPYDEDHYRQEALEAHNNKRGLHNCSPLKLNEKLCKIAKKCANKISNGDSFIGNFYEGKILGENISIFKDIHLDPKEICEEWYNEKEKYDRENPKYQNNTGHFTQMIWKETKEIGFGFNKNKGTYYVVVYYYPPGNTLGEFQENVTFPN